MLNALKSATSDCKLTMAGTADRVYFFDKDAWATAIEGLTLTGTDKGIPTPGYMGYYGVTAEGAVDDDAVKKLNALNGLLYAVDIKPESGQVTSEKGADNEASSQKATFVVKDNMKAFNELAHTLAFKKWGCIVEGLGVIYMVMSPWKSCKFENNFDSGTTYDSDYGFTVNVDASPAEYGVTYLPDGSTLAGTTAISKTTINVTTTGGTTTVSFAVA